MHNDLGKEKESFENFVDNFLPMSWNSRGGQSRSDHRWVYNDTHIQMMWLTWQVAKGWDNA